MSQPLGRLSVEEWQDIHAIYTEVSQCLREVSAHQREQADRSSLGEFPCVKNQVTVCCCPRCGERFPRLAPDQAARESAERQRNFSHKGVRVKNLAAKRSGDHNGVQQGWQ